MSYEAVVIPTMIASPGDVLEEREVVRDVIHEWNYINSLSSRIVLMPVSWETHSSPELSGRPQELINERVLKDCDLLVGIFWTKLGTPTGKSASGSVEEIERHLKAGKPAMVYFSTKPVAPQSIDQDQYEAVSKFREWCKEKGLVGEFENIVDFRSKFTRELQILLDKNPYISEIIGNDYQNKMASNTSSIDKNKNEEEFFMSDEAVQLLVEASSDSSGVIINVAHMGGRRIQTNGKAFGDPSDRRSMARWEYALNQLVDFGFVVDRGYKGEMFELTESGYQMADKFQQPRK